MKKVYLVRTGTLHPTTNTYWFTNYYHTSLRSANKEFNQILDINRAINQNTDDYPKGIYGAKKYVDYQTLCDGKLVKARLILEVHELKTL